MTKQRLCPNDTKTPLTTRTSFSVEIDECPKCHGIWLERGELEKILRHARGDRDRQGMDKDDAVHTAVAGESLVSLLGQFFR